MEKALELCGGQPAVPVVRLTGEIDLANATEVFAGVRAEVDGAGVIVDLSDVTFIDSSGLSEIVSLARETAVRLVAPPRRAPRRALDMTKLSAAIPTFHTVGAAAAENVVRRP
jgi:anti-anti-sigma factor